MNENSNAALWLIGAALLIFGGLLKALRNPNTITEAFGEVTRGWLIVGGMGLGAVCLIIVFTLAREQSWRDEKGNRRDWNRRWDD